jgi:hypothetical protein
MAYGRRDRIPNNKPLTLSTSLRGRRNVMPKNHGGSGSQSEKDGGRKRKRTRRGGKNRKKKRRTDSPVVVIKEDTRPESQHHFIDDDLSTVPEDGDHWEQVEREDRQGEHRTENEETGSSDDPNEIARQRTLSLLRDPDKERTTETVLETVTERASPEQTQRVDEIIKGLVVASETPTMASPEAVQPELLKPFVTRQMRLADFRPLQSVPEWARAAVERQIVAYATGMEWRTEKREDGSQVQKQVPQEVVDKTMMRAAWSMFAKMDNLELQKLKALQENDPVLGRTDVDETGRPLSEEQQEDRRRAKEIMLDRIRHAQSDDDDGTVAQINDEKSALLMLNQILRQLQRRRADDAREA